MARLSAAAVEYTELQVFKHTLVCSWSIGRVEFGRCGFSDVPDVVSSPAVSRMFLSS